MVHVIAGATEFDIIVKDEIETLHLAAGNVIVPKGCWHLPFADGVTLMTATPKGEPHLFVDAKLKLFSEIADGFPRSISG